MSKNIKSLEGLAKQVEIFELDVEGNVTFVKPPLFELDGNGDVMPTLTGTEDTYWEVDGDNNITPKL